jgi:steroid delta-isomerase-like uncharacterized protein
MRAAGWPGGALVSVEENKAVVRRFLDEVISAGNLSALDATCARDLVWHSGSFGDINGLEGFGQMLGPFLSAFSSLRVTPEDFVGEGDRVVCRYTWRGTHSGDLFGTPASGRQVEIGGLSMYRVAGGKIAEEWWLEDIAGLMQQLGAGPGQR